MKPQFSKYPIVRLFIAFALYGSCQLSAAPSLPSVWWSSDKWQFNSGSEFPGAVGAFDLQNEDGKESIAVDFDFSGGGEYVAVVNQTPIDDPFSELQFSSQSNVPTRLGVRLVDANGHVFQYALEGDVGSEWQDYRIRLDEKPQLVFGAEGPLNESIALEFPIKGIWFTISAPGSQTGRLQINRVRLIK
jgi:hypothetical protein